jgi:hypothetical protein
VEFRAVSGERWPDLERLFSESASEELGNPSRCWCMEWRLASHREWREAAEAGGEGNREGMRRFVASGQVPGIIAYVDGVPAAWCSVSPKHQLIGLARLGERYGRFDDGEEWAVICFYVAEKHLGSGLMGQLVAAAANYAGENGARLVEGYPMDAGWETDGAGGTRKAFELAGFVELRRAGEHQSVMVRHADLHRMQSE